MAKHLGKLTHAATSTSSIIVALAAKELPAGFFVAAARASLAKCCKPVPEIKPWGPYVSACKYQPGIGHCMAMLNYVHAFGQSNNAHFFAGQVPPGEKKISGPARTQLPRIVACGVLNEIRNLLQWHPHLMRHAPLKSYEVTSLILSDVHFQANESF